MNNNINNITNIAINERTYKKVKMYTKYINDNNLEHKIFDPVKKRLFTTELYLTLYFTFEKIGVSYNLFYELLSLGYELGKNNINFPKHSAFC